MISRYLTLSRTAFVLRADDGEHEAAEARLRLHVVLLIAIVSAWGIWAAGQQGLSKLYSVYGSRNGSVAMTAKAVALSEHDPDAHHAHASVLRDKGMIPEAAEALKLAIASRPRDYLLWLDLARVRSDLGDKQGVLAALNEAARLAPFYAQPMWQLGNFLLREGETEKAFSILRRAARRDQKLLDPTMRLAWDAYGGDTEAVAQAIKPQNAAMKVALARFFIERDHVTEGLSLYRLATDDTSGKGYRDILAALVSAKRFDEALDLLRTSRATDQDYSVIITGLIANNRVTEAATLLRQFEASERLRRQVLNSLLGAGLFNETISLLRETDSSEQERRAALTNMLAAKRLDEAFELSKTMSGEERSRRALLKELLGAGKLDRAAEMVRVEGTSEQDRQLVIQTLLKDKMFTEAVELALAVGVSESRRRDMLKALLEAGRYSDAYRVWSLNRNGANPSTAQEESEVVTDGGFEGDITAEEYGFGWRLSPKMQSVRAALDSHEPHSGTRSIHFEFSGNSRQTDQIMSQLAVVAPNARYRLSFAARTNDLVSGCPPVVAVTDAASGRVLAQFAPLPQGTHGWTNQSADFVTGSRTGAVTITLLRDTGANKMCPIFGGIRLDSFSLRRL